MSTFLNLDWWLVLLERRALRSAAAMIRQRWEINGGRESLSHHEERPPDPPAACGPPAVLCAPGELPDTVRKQLQALYPEGGWVWRMLKLWVPPRDVEDAFHDVFVRAILRMSTYDPQKGSLRAWLMGIAHHIAMERRRDRWRRWLSLADGSPSPETTGPQEASSWAGSDRGGEPVLPGDVDGGGGADRLTEADRINRVFERMSNVDVEVLVLHDAFGFTVTELAAGLRKSEHAIRSRLARARHRFEVELRNLERRRDGHRG